MIVLPVERTEKTASSLDDDRIAHEILLCGTEATCFPMHSAAFFSLSLCPIDSIYCRRRRNGQSHLCPWEKTAERQDVLLLFWFMISDNILLIKGLWYQTGVRLSLYNGLNSITTHWCRCRIYPPSSPTPFSSVPLILRDRGSSDNTIGATHWPFESLAIL